MLWMLDVVGEEKGKSKDQPLVKERLMLTKEEEQLLLAKEEEPLLKEELKLEMMTGEGFLGQVQGSL